MVSESTYASFPRHHIPSHEMEFVRGIYNPVITPCSNPSFLFTIVTIIGDLVGQTKNRGASLRGKVL